MKSAENGTDSEPSLYCMKNQADLKGESAECPNPRVYCKFRSACPVWFLTRQKAIARRDQEKEEETPEALCRVSFQPGGEQAEVSPGNTLLNAARKVDVRLNASCNGKGSCGKCKLVVVSGQVTASATPLLSEQELKKGTVLACQAKVSGDVTVRIPEETLEKKLKVAGMGDAATKRLEGLVPEISPIFVDVPVQMAPPSLEDSTSDVDRLSVALRAAGVDTANLVMGLDVIRSTAAALRDGHWTATASVIRYRGAREVVRVVPGTEPSRQLGLAVDIGTTSVVAYLVDMADGTVLGASADHNRQAACGDDVINRIACSEKDGVEKLNRMALATINGLVTELLDSTGALPTQITNVSISGNTIMTHLFLGIDPRHIRREPYVPTTSTYPVLKAGELGLKAHPRAAVFVMPGPASYVGGDIVAGIVYSGLHREDPITLFIDVGTNGEIVLGNRDWLMAASCSAGPAFEGGGVRWGMRAEDGAIEKVNITTGGVNVDYSVVGGSAPRGICGSAMIDLLSEMFLKGILDARGRIVVDPSHPRLRSDRHGKAFVVAREEDSATGEEIVFTEADIDNILRSKGAVYAGFRVLLKEAGLDFSVVERVWIAGGFGQYLDIEKAINIGLLPDIDRDKFTYFGNSSIAGTYMALLSREARREARRIAREITYLDFSSNNLFMSEYTSALFLPHTDLNDFPHVRAQIETMGERSA